MQDSNCKHSGDSFILLEQGSKAKEQLSCYFKSASHVSTCTSIPSLAWGPGVQRKKLSQYLKLHIQLGLLLLPKRQLFFLFFLTIIPQHSNFYSRALVYVSRPLILLLANFYFLFPKGTSQALKCFFAGLQRPVRSTEVVVQNHHSSFPGKRIVKHISGSQLIPDIQASLPLFSLSLPECEGICLGLCGCSACTGPWLRHSLHIIWRVLWVKLFSLLGFWKHCFFPQSLTPGRAQDWICCLCSVPCVRLFAFPVCHFSHTCPADWRETRQLLLQDELPRGRLEPQMEPRGLKLQIQAFCLFEHYV